LSAHGTTVFLSSHLLSEIDQICTHAAVISAGKVVAQAPIEELRASRQKTLRIHTPDVAIAITSLADLGGVSVSGSEQPANGDEAGYLDLMLDSTLAETVAAHLVKHDVRLRGMNEVGGTLEDAFVALTGEGFDVAE
jgi:ABC-2 type transport system ATP-binding protein